MSWAGTSCVFSGKRKSAGSIENLQREMKTYSISRWTFILIAILILALPVSRRWRLILNGKKTTGVVSAFGPLAVKQSNGTRVVEYASQIYFHTDDSIHITVGPPNYKYDMGRAVGVLYDPDNPDDNCILTFSGLYLSDYTALPLILLIFWAAFYLSFNRYSKYARGRKKKREDLATSPYHPFRRAKKEDDGNTKNDRIEITEGDSDA